MILRAQTLNNETVYFGIEDGPVCINDKQTILCNRENSPMLLTKTIARGLKEENLFEFDFVLSKSNCKFLGYVVYKGGFQIWEPKSGMLTPIYDMSGIELVENSTGNRVDEINEIRDSIRFSNESRLFRLSRVMYASGDDIYIELKRGAKPVNIGDIDFCTGIGSGHKELAFGHYVSDGEIVLHNYHPMVRLADNTYRELEESDYE